MKTSDVKIGGTENVAKIEVVNGPFTGTIFSFGEVKFPDENQPILSFHYYILEGTVSDVPVFEKEIGDLLVDLLREHIERKEVIYHGGVD